MNNTLIHNVQLVFPGIAIRTGYVCIEKGKINAVADDTPPADYCGSVIDGQGKLLTPGLIDLHTHGVGEELYEAGGASMHAAVQRLGEFGVTCLTPTLVPKPDDAFLAKLADLSAAMNSIDTVTIPGLHLEGPFMTYSGAACDTVDGDIGLLEAFIAAADGRVSIMSLSPEAKNILPVIERLLEHQIVPFITHTQADVATTQKVIDAGARHATHFYDGFLVPEETDPGVRPVGAVECVLADPRATCDFICDGIHVHPTAIRAAVAAKGWQGVSLITDSSFGAGMPPGRYDTPWGYPVEVKPGGAPRIMDPDHPFYGALAGSALTMNRGMSNLLHWLDLPPEQVWAMGTLNPATTLGLASTGQLDVGMDADVVLWDTIEDELTVVSTWVNGKQVYNRTD